MGRGDNFGDYNEGSESGRAERCPNCRNTDRSERHMPDGSYTGDDFWCVHPWHDASSAASTGTPARGTYWCCSADFGQHDPNCPNAIAPSEPEICGHVSYPGGNELICVAPKGHEGKHNSFPRYMGGPPLAPSEPGSAEQWIGDLPDNLDYKCGKLHYPPQGLKDIAALCEAYATSLRAQLQERELDLAKAKESYAALWKDRDEQEHKRAEYFRELRDANEKLAASEATIQSMREYTQHKGSCAVVQKARKKIDGVWQLLPCDCGLAALAHPKAGKDQK